MKNNTLIIVLILIPLLFQCNKDKGRLIGKYKFSSEDLNILPYTNGENISLIDSLGDSIHYVISSRITNTNTYYDYNNPYYTADHSTIKAVDYYLADENITTANGNFKIELEFSDIYREPLQKLIYFNIGINKYPEIRNFTGWSAFNNDSIFKPNTYFLEDILQISFYDTLILNTRTFYYIYSFSRITQQDTIDDITTIYYSTYQGIVGLKTKNNRLWVLL